MGSKITVNDLTEVFGHENVFFIRNGVKRTAICTCGHVMDDGIFRFKCPHCKTRIREIYTNKSNRPVEIIGLIYFDIEDITEKSFLLKRYDLVYRIDARNESVTPFVREHSYMRYNYDSDNIVCYIYKSTKEDEPAAMRKYRNRSFTTINDDEIRKKIPQCKHFYTRTGFKEIVELYEKRRRKWGIDLLLDYIEYYHNEGNTGIELLLKAGFIKLALELFDNKAPLPRGTTIKDIIKLPKSILNNQIVKEEYNFDRIKVLEHLHTKGGGLTIEHFEFINAMHRSYHTEPLNRIRNLVENGYTIKEIKNYLDRVDQYQAINQREALQIFSDYVNMAVQARVLFDRFPNSLKKAHDLMLREYKYIEDEVHSRQVLERIEENKNLAYEGEEFSIALPKDAADIVREGNKLCHCVASYIKNVAIGDSFIVFLRKKKEKDKPFYTIEIQNNRVVQIRGLANSKLKDSKAKEFIRDWSRKNKLYIAST